MTLKHLVKAVDKAIEIIELGENMLVAECFVGFMHGHYISVKAYQFDQKLLKNHPETGGLLINKHRKGVKNGRV